MFLQESETIKIVRLLLRQREKYYAPRDVPLPFKWGGGRRTQLTMFLALENVHSSRADTNIRVVQLFTLA